MITALTYGELYMRTSAVKFADLRRVLLDLGFTEATNPKSLLFNHIPSDTVFVLRRYRPGDRVTWYNLASVLEMLDQRGLMEAEAFADRLKKTPA
jgi:hypothetical protein